MPEKGLDSRDTRIMMLARSPTERGRHPHAWQLAATALSRLKALRLPVATFEQRPHFCPHGG